AAPMIATFISELLGPHSTTGLGGTVDRAQQPDGLGPVGGADSGSGAGTDRGQHVPPLLHVSGDTDGPRICSTAADPTGSCRRGYTVDVPAQHLTLTELDDAPIGV